MSGNGSPRGLALLGAIAQGAILPGDVDQPPGLHPLEPLGAEEIGAASSILKAEKGLGPTARFVFVTLHEPPKAAVQAGERVPREAFVVLYERAQRATYEAVVSLTEEAVVSWRRIEGVQSPVTFEEFMACEAAVQADPRWQAALRARGVEDFSLAMVDPWAAGYLGPEDAATERRFLRPLTWLRSEPGEHGYARPVEGLVVEFDLDRMQVTAVHDHGVVPLPPRPGNYDAARMAAADNVPSFAAPRDDLKPIEITQPERPELHRRGPRRALAEVAPADRLHAARGSRAARHRLRGPRDGPPDRLPRVAERDVRPLRRPGADARVQERVRHGRVRRRLARQPARARLRLPRRDPLLRRRRQRPGRRADDDPERDLHARGGRRHRLEAHRLPHRRRRGAAAAPARDLDRSRPSATTSTGTSGTSTPTARSSTRSSSPA